MPRLASAWDDRIKWTFGLAGLLLYILVITSYRLPLGEVAIMMSLGGAVLQRGHARFPAYLGWFVAFAIWAVLSSMQTDYPDWVMPELVTLIKLCLIVFAAASALQTPAQLRVFMVFFLGCFALFPLRGAVFNFFIYHSDMQGRAIWNLLYSNPNDLGAMALLQLSMTCALLVVVPKGWVRWAATAGVIALPMLILMTQSRGVFLGLTVFIVLAFLGHHRRLRLTLQLLIVAAVLASAAPSSVWARLQTLRSATDASTLDDVDGAEGSARQRYEIWRVAFKIIREHPITGVGIGAYRPVHEQYALNPEFNPTAEGQRDTHSLYFNVLAETGFPGFALYIGMLCVVMYTAERARRRCKRVFQTGAKQLLLLEAGLLAFLVASIFGSLPYLPHLLLHLVLLYAVSKVSLAHAARNAAYLGMNGPHGGGRASIARAANPRSSNRVLKRPRRAAGPG
ncbi:MAG TPA: O-antigen ligase family protein [Gemmatimonadaceae bacterium]